MILGPYGSGETPRPPVPPPRPPTERAQCEDEHDESLPDEFGCPVRAAETTRRTPDPSPTQKRRGGADTAAAREEKALGHNGDLFWRESEEPEAQARGRSFHA
ncbi:unnamed protein product, partial [Cyprideis torosa]